jgi:hypothetical protein
LTFSEKALFRIELFLKSAGIYPGDDQDIDLRPEDCIGLSGWCETIDEQQDNGKTYARIDTWLAAQKQTPLQQMIQRNAATAKSSKYDRDEPPDWNHDGNGPTGDDIPF